MLTILLQLRQTTSSCYDHLTSPPCFLCNNDTQIISALAHMNTSPQQTIKLARPSTTNKFLFTGAFTPLFLCLSQRVMERRMADRLVGKNSFGWGGKSGRSGPNSHRHLLWRNGRGRLDDHHSTLFRMPPVPAWSITTYGSDFLGCFACSVIGEAWGGAGTCYSCFPTRRGRGAAENIGRVVWGEEMRWGARWNELCTIDNDHMRTEEGWGRGATMVVPPVRSSWFRWSMI